VVVYSVWLMLSGRSFPVMVHPDLWDAIGDQIAKYENDNTASQSGKSKVN
jgi:hypothetical protein